MGEAPGRAEDREGVPFVGPAGQVLRRGLRAAGLDDESGFYFNAVSCYPGGTPGEEELRACRVHLRAQLDLAPQFVLVCGTIALSSLLPGVSPGSSRGVCVEAHGHQLFPVWHPSFILRQRGSKRYEIRAEWEDQLGRFRDLVLGFVQPEETYGVCIYKSSTATCSSRNPLPGELTCRSHRSRLAKTRTWKDPGIQQKLL